jgi:hypothetical protein
MWSDTFSFFSISYMFSPSLCLDYAFFDLEFGLEMDSWDAKMLTGEEVALRFAGFEKINHGEQTVLFVIHNAYNNVDIRASLVASNYKMVEQIIVHKVYKTWQNFRIGHIPSHLTCHLATKTAEIWDNPTQSKEGKKRQSVWRINYAPQHEKDDTGVAINKCLQSPDLVRRVIGLFPAPCFGAKKLLVFSSGEACGWVAPLALEMGFNCICTEPDDQQYTTLVGRLHEKLPSYTAKLRAVREQSELKAKETQVDKTRKASHLEQVLEEQRRFLDMGLAPEDAAEKAERYVQQKEKKEEEENKPDDDEPPTPSTPLPEIPEEGAEPVETLFCPNCSQLLTEGHQCETPGGGPGIRSFRQTYGARIDLAKEIVGQSTASLGSTTRGNRMIPSDESSWTYEDQEQYDKQYFIHPDAGGTSSGAPFPFFDARRSFIPPPPQPPTFFGAFNPYSAPPPVLGRGASIAGGYPSFTSWLPTPPMPGYVRTFSCFSCLLSFFRDWNRLVVLVRTRTTGTPSTLPAPLMTTMTIQGMCTTSYI